MPEQFRRRRPVTDRYRISSRVASLEALTRQQQALIEEQGALIQELRARQREEGDECVFRSSEIEIVTGTSNPDLGREIGEALGKKTDDKAVTVFADKSPNVKMSNNLRNKHVFIVQPTSPPDIPRAAIELLLMIDAAKRASAREITAVIPYDGFGRSDKKDEPRVPIGAALMAHLIKSAGGNRIIGMDPHAGQSQGFFDGPVDILYGSRVLLPAIAADFPHPVVMVSPDTGFAKPAEKLSSIYEYATDSGSIYKRRPKANESEATGFMGGVRGLNALIVDESADTLGTLCNAADRLKNAEGAAHIGAMATHGLFSEVPEKGKFPLDLLTRSSIEWLYVTNTIAHRADVLAHPKIRVISAASLFAEAIKRAHTGQSISDLIPKPNGKKYQGITLPSSPSIARIS